MSWATENLWKALAKYGIYPNTDKNKFAFPTNGVQRDTCERCLFFGGRFDPELRSTICMFPTNNQNGKNEMIPYSYQEEMINPELRAKRQRPCPCYIDKEITIDTCRKYILNQLEEADHGEEE